MAQGGGHGPLIWPTVRAYIQMCIEGKGVEVSDRGVRGWSRPPNLANRKGSTGTYTILC